MPYSGWLQHVLVQTSGKVILSDARCCRSNLPLLSKSMTLNARWSMPLGWPTTHLCALYLLSWPMTWSAKSSKMHSSFNIKSSWLLPSALQTSPLGVAMACLRGGFAAAVDRRMSATARILAAAPVVTDSGMSNASQLTEL